MDDLKILENSRLFAGIRVDEIQPMLSCLQAVERKYPRGAYIFHTGEEVRALALLVRGTAHIQKEDFWGNRSLLASLAAGDVFAEAYAMPGSGAMRSDVVAVESCTVLLMDVERVLSRCTNSCAFHARLTENLFALLAEKNRILARKVDYLAQRTTRQRLLAYLSEQAQRAGSAEFTIPFNRQQLADFLSVERSAMSAELSRMQAEGLIETERSYFRLKETNPAGMCVLAGFPGSGQFESRPISSRCSG